MSAPRVGASGAAAWLVLPFAVVAVAWFGATAVSAPLVAVGMAGVLCALVLAAAYARRMPRLFLGSLWALLILYTLVGKGGAYVNVGGVFVGEMVLGVGVLATVCGGLAFPAFRSKLTWMIVAFGVIGLLQTVPYFHEYRIVALRDAVVWGYGVFAIFVAGGLLRTGWIPRVVERYARLFVWLPYWVPVLWAIAHYAGDANPRVPGTDIPFFYFKAGDPAFHLVGIAAFVLLGLGRRPGEPRRGGQFGPGGLIWWAVWLVGFAIVGASSRGAMLAMMIGVGTVFALRPSTPFSRPMVVGFAAGMLFFASDIKLEVREGRYLSPSEMISNLASFSGQRAPGNRDATREWRLQWWKDIVNYTVFGQYFWTGKGFGVNIAQEDGYETEQGDYPLRSPHNSHLTVLARSGVPGFALWVGLQVAFLVVVIRLCRMLRRSPDDWWGRVALWVLAYWVTFAINAAFEVSLEGPHGGIWFWSLFGFAIALHETAKAQERAQRGARAPVVTAYASPAAVPVAAAVRPSVPRA